MFRTKHLEDVASDVKATVKGNVTANGRAMADEARERLDSAREQAREGIATAREQAREGLGSARESAAEAGHHAAEAGHHAADSARESAHEAAEHARDALASAWHDLADRAKPKAEAARSSLAENVLPKVGAVLGAAATAVAERAEHAREAAVPQVEQVERAVLQARDSARESASVERARDAYRVLRGEAMAVPIKKRHRLRWLIGLGLIAAGAAAFAAFRRQQQGLEASDPWREPYQSPSAPGATPEVETGSDLKNAAAEKVEQLKDVVAGGTPSNGQVTAVDPAPDSDAITSDAINGSAVVPTPRRGRKDDPEGVA